MDIDAVRIAIYSEVGDPDRRLVSGVTNLLDRLVEFGAQRHLDLSLVTFGTQEADRARGSVRIRTLAPRLPVEIYPDLVVDMLPVRRRDLRHEIDWCPDVVLVVSPGPMGAFGARVARACAAPLIALYTTDFPAYLRARIEKLPGPSALRRPLLRAVDRLAWRTQRRVYDRAARILAPSRITADAIRESFAAPVGVLGRGVDTDRFRPREEEPGRRARRAPSLLYTGRVHIGEKNLGRLLDVAAALPEARLRVVGEGPDRAALEQALGPRAELTGQLEGEALARAYREADLFVFPSVYDTLGQVVLEAMASGVPAVVTDQGGPQELVRHGRTGLVVPEREFVDRVAELARNPHRRARMARAARAAALGHTWDRIFGQLLALCAATLDQAVSRRARRRPTPMLAAPGR